MINRVLQGGRVKWKSPCTWHRVTPPLIGARIASGNELLTPFVQGQCQKCIWTRLHLLPHVLVIPLEITANRLQAPRFSIADNIFLKGNNVWASATRQEFLVLLTMGKIWLRPWGRITKKGVKPSLSPQQLWFPNDTSHPIFYFHNWGGT